MMKFQGIFIPIHKPLTAYERYHMLFKDPLSLHYYYSMDQFLLFMKSIEPANMTNKQKEVWYNKAEILITASQDYCDLVKDNNAFLEFQSEMISYYEYSNGLFPK